LLFLSGDEVLAAFGECGVLGGVGGCTGGLSLGAGRWGAVAGAAGCGRCGEGMLRERPVGRPKPRADSLEVEFIDSKILPANTKGAD
jgi:hypothetical protein